MHAYQSIEQFPHYISNEKKIIASEGQGGRVMKNLSRNFNQIPFGK